MSKYIIPLYQFHYFYTPLWSREHSKYREIIQ